MKRYQEMRASMTRFFLPQAGTSKTMIVVNSDYGLYTAIKEAKVAGWNTVAIHPVHSQYNGDADLSLPVENIMNVEAVLKAIETAQRHFPGTKGYVHPVYGYHSERTELNKAVSARKNLVMVAAPADLIYQCGDKREARKLVSSLRIPVIPGYHEDDTRLTTLLAQWKGLGNKPVMLKAPDGGGGKGNRIVRTHDELSQALFDLGQNVILESLLVGRYKQIEAQIFISKTGPLYLAPRDCSEQWRFQKKGREIGFQTTILTELLPGFTEIDSYQRKLGEYLFEHGYQGPITAEFLLDSDTGLIYFVEMNTRLQVENHASGIPNGVNILTMQRVNAAGESLDDYVDSLLMAKQISHSKQLALQAKLTLLADHSPKVCVQQRIYGYDTHVEQVGHHRILANLPTKGQAETLHFPRSQQGYVDSFLRSGMPINTSVMDGMLGIVYGYGDSVKIATAAVDSLVKQTELSLPTNIPTTLAWLSEAGKRDYADIHTGSLESYLASSLWSQPLSRDSHSEGHYSEHAPRCFSRT